VDQTLDGQNEPPWNPPLPKAAKGGAYLGLTVGWLGGLIYVLVVFPSIGFEQQSSADGILMGAPIIGAAIGISIGFLLRNSDRVARLTAPDWITLKEVKWVGEQVESLVSLYKRQFAAWFLYWEYRLGV
jgi:hypothetical protein